MKKNSIKRILIILVIFLGLPISAAWLLITQPVLSNSNPSKLNVSSDRLRQHLLRLSVDFHPRDYKSINNLNRCADYIAEEFTKAGAHVKIQNFKAWDREYKNVIGFFGNKNGERIVIGAHYDTDNNGTPGADDNASGVAGLIELAYLLGREKINSGVELVAYSLEEPPSFGTSNMGSYAHASSLKDNNISVKFAIALEMIGFFSNEPGSQSYPAPLLKLFYPSKGNFITIVGRLDHIPITRKIKGVMKGAAGLPVYSINAPAFVQGIDYSDHRNYWEFGFDAVMITDTSFYRNDNYHKNTDTADTLDYERMGQVVTQVAEVVKSF